MFFFIPFQFTFSTSRVYLEHRCRLALARLFANSKRCDHCPRCTLLSSTEHRFHKKLKSCRAALLLMGQQPKFICLLIRLQPIYTDRARWIRVILFIEPHQSDLFETVAHSITHKCAFVLITHQGSTLLLDKAHKTVCV